MAVEIPVVVDINAAFKEAAAQVPTAIRPLKQSIDKYSEDLMSWTEKMRSAKIDSPEFIKAAKNIQAISQALEVAEDRLLKFSSNPGSIRRMSGELAALERRWQEMGSKQKFDASGNLSADAQKLYESYKKMAAAIAESGKSLSQMYSEEQKVAEEQRKAVAAAQEHQRALSMCGSTVERLRITTEAWQKELNNTSLFSDPQRLAVVAQNAEYLARRMAEVSAQLKIIGANSGSIDQLNLRLQEITRQFNSISASERGGATGRALLDDYKKISKELQSQGKTIEQIIQEEKRLDAIKKQSLQTRRQENAILRMTGDSMRILQAQEAILSQRLSKAKFGSAEFEQLQTRLDGVRKKLKEVQGGVDKVSASMQKQSGILRSLTSMASMYFSVFGALRFVKQIRDVTGELEFQRIALGRLLQDEEYGNKLFEKIKEAAVQSPFRIKDLVTYTKQLAAYRVEQEDLYDTTKRLADISAGLGVDMNRLILAYGQVRAASVLRGQELRQFTEAGIPLVELLAEKFSELRDESVSTADVFELISKRAVPFSMIAEIFEDLTDKGGMFFDMQKKQAETLKGQWEKLKDTYDIALQSIGETKTFERYNSAILGALRFLAQHLAIVPKLIEGATAAWVLYYAATTKSRIATRQAAMAEIYEATAKEAQSIANIKGIKFVDAYTKALVRQRVAATGLGRAFWGLWAAIVANPLGAAIAAIGGIAAALFFWNKRTKEVEQSNIDLSETMEKLSTAEKEHKKVERLANTYEHLASKSEKSAKENLKLSQTIDALSERFPGLTLKVDDDTAAIERNTKAIQDNNEKRLEDARKEAEEELKVAETNLSMLEKDRDEKRWKYEVERSKVVSQSDLSGTVFESALQRDIDAAKAAKDAWLKAVEEYNKALKDVTRLREKLNPDEEKNLASWKDAVIKIQKEKEAAGAIPIFSDTDIEKFESVLKFSNELKQKQDEYNQSLKTNQELLKTATDLTKDKIQADITSDQETLKMIEAIKVALGLVFKTSSGGSDNRLSNLKKDISEITNAFKKFLDLRKYMGVKDALGEINLLFPQLSGWEPTFENTIEKLQKMRDEVSAKLARSPKDKTLLEMQRALDTEISNLKFDALKKKVDDEWKRISDELKRSETARNFYNNILGLTGDQDLAASITMSVYGGVGEDFKERLQRELYTALKNVPAGELSKEISDEFSGAITTMDTAFFRQNLGKLPENIREIFSKALDEAETFNAKWVEDILKTYEKTKDFEERITDIRKREAEARRLIQASTLPEDEKVRLIGASLSKEEQDVADVEVEALKSTDEWIRTFEDLDKVGTMTLEKLISMLEELIDKNGASMNAGTLRSLTKSLEQAKEQVYTRSPFTTFTAGAKSYVESISAIIRARKRWKKEDDPEAQGALAAAYDQRNEALEKMKSAVDGVSNVFNNLNTIVSSTTELLNLDELSDGQAVLSGIATGLGLVGTALTFINAVLTMMKTDPIVLAISGVVAAAASIGSILSNIRVNRANREIETQSKLLEDLEYQYGRLETAIAKSFGSDYITNYNQQIDTLLAKQEAYMKQAEAERSKGKKADEDKIKEYTNNARAAADQIADMQTQLSEFFSGTDLTSAAKDFASAWIDAYKEFGSVTDAMGEKFRDMIQEMVQNSVAAQVMQQLLQPIFDEIDTLAREGGELSVEDIAAISKLASDQIPAINDAMTTLMNSLRAAGYNIREQPGQFTGISRNVANATEESITGLAAGINTQNFYMSMINQNVAAILAVISGGSVPAEGGVSSVQFNNELALQHLSSINDKLSSILNQLDKVIKPTSVSAQYYVAVRQ